MIVLVGRGSARDHGCALRLAAERKGTFRCYLTGNNALLEQEPWTTQCGGMSLEAVAHVAAADKAATVVILDPVLLIAGAADQFRAEGLTVIGPGTDAAAMEGSKATMKRVLAQAGVLAPESVEVTQLSEAEAFLATEWRGASRFVLKAEHYIPDANLRTLVPDGRLEAYAGARRQFAALARAGLPPSLLIERRLDGWETSVHVLWDGHDYLLLPPVRDYKRVANGDTGPNTQGAAAIACGRGFEPRFEARLRSNVIEPILATMERFGLAYPGVVYFGVMIADDVPHVLEVNVRPGNPEVLAILGLLDSEFAELLEHCARGTLGMARAAWREADYCGAVFALAAGYPDRDQFQPVPIAGLDQHYRGALLAEGVGRSADGAYIVGGGRVVAAVAVANCVDAVRETALADLERVEFAGKHNRTDLGAGIWDGLFAAPVSSSASRPD